MRMLPIARRGTKLKADTFLKSIEVAKQREKIEYRCEEDKSKRAAIEGTNSALKRSHGLSKL